MEFLARIAPPLVFVSVVALMLGVGLELAVRQVLDVTKEVRPLALGLLANFVVTPLVFYGLVLLAGSPPMLLTGMLIVAAVPIAPMAPPFTQAAGGDVPFAAGLMTICAFLTVPLAPLILDVGLASGGQAVHVDALGIARTLLLAMLAPTGLGMLIRHFSERAAGRLGKVVIPLGRLGLVASVVVLLVLHGESVVSLAPEAHLVIVSSIVIGIAIGHWVMIGESSERKRAHGICTGMRNIALAILIVNANFAGTEAVAVVMAQGLLSLVIAMAYGLMCARLSRRSAG